MSAPRQNRADAQAVSLTEALDHMDEVTRAFQYLRQIEHLAASGNGARFFHKYALTEDRLLHNKDNCPACTAFRALGNALESYGNLARATAERSAEGASTAPEDTCSSGSQA